MASLLQDEIKQTKPFKSLRQEALLQMARSTAVLLHAWEQSLRIHGITLTQYNVLRILRGAGDAGLCRHAIASRLITQVPDVSRLLDRMTTAKLVTRTRNSEDRRLVKACITEKGLSILSDLDAPSYVLIDQSMAHMSDDEIKTLIHLLERARTVPDTLSA